VSRTHASMFRILLPAEFHVTLRVLKVRETIPMDGKRPHRLHKWAGEMWRRHLHAPVIPWQTRTSPSFLIPASVADRANGITFRDVPNIDYHLDLTDELVTVRLDEEDPAKRILVERLLERSVTDGCCQLRDKYWRWHWTLFYRMEPENGDVSDRIVDAYRGMKFSVIWLEDSGPHLAADVRTKYMGRRSLADYWERGEEEQISAHLDTESRGPWQRRPHFIRDNGPVRFSCVFAGKSNDVASEVTFFDDAIGRKATVQDYYRRRYRLSIPANDPVVYVQDAEHRDPIPVPASRLFPAFDTELIRDVHAALPRDQAKRVWPPSAQIAPNERARIIREFITDLPEVHFEGWTIDIEGSLFDQDRTWYMPPNLAFGEGAELRYGEHVPLPDARGVSDERLIVEWHQAKLPELYKHGAFAAADLPRLVLLVPGCWNRSLRETLQKGLTDELMRQLKRKVSIDEQILYKDDRTGTDLLEAIREPIQRTLFVVGLSRRARPFVHDQIKRVSPQGIGSQCFSERTAHRIAKGSASHCRNLALAVLTEAGTKPWVLTSPLAFSTYVGVDVLENRAAFHFFFGPCAQEIRFIPARSSAQARRQEAIKRPIVAQYLIQGLREIVDCTREPVSSLAVHRDGRWWPPEQEGLEDALRTSRAEGLVSDDLRVAVVEVRKSHAPIRLLGARKRSGGELSYINPVPGVYLKIDSQKLLLVCASKTVAWDSDNGRTAGTLLLQLAHSAPPADIVALGMDAYFLTQLNWSAPDIPINVPVTIRWADDRLREYLLDAVEAEEDAFAEEDDEGQDWLTLAEA